jgi:hypothetical protein
LIAGDIRFRLDEPVEVLKQAFTGVLVGMENESIAK